MTKPFRKYRYSFIVHLPFSHFHFRPLLSDDLYMALGLWEIYVRRHIRLGIGDVFIDVGAHIGNYAARASRKVGSSGLVIAIEPDERNLRVLRKNLGSLNNTQIIEGAVGCADKLYLVTSSEPVYNRTETCNNSQGLEEIKSLRLDELVTILDNFMTKVSRKPKVVIKVDVEGNELDVIRSGLALIRKYSPTIIIEGLDPPQLKTTMAEISYGITKIWGSYYLAVPL